MNCWASGQTHVKLYLKNYRAAKPGSRLCGAPAPCTHSFCIAEVPCKAIQCVMKMSMCDHRILQSSRGWHAFIMLFLTYERLSIPSWRAIPARNLQFVRKRTSCKQSGITVWTEFHYDVYRWGPTWRSDIPPKIVILRAQYFAIDQNSSNLQLL